VSSCGCVPGRRSRRGVSAMREDVGAGVGAATRPWSSTRSPTGGWMYCPTARLQRGGTAACAARSRRRRPWAGSAGCWVSPAASGRREQTSWELLKTARDKPQILLRDPGVEVRAARLTASGPDWHETQRPSQGVRARRQRRRRGLLRPRRPTANAGISGRSHRCRGPRRRRRKPITRSTPARLYHERSNQHDLPGGWQLGDVAVEVPLAAFGLDGLRQRDDPCGARVEVLHERFGGAALAGGVAALEEDQVLGAGVLGPVLELQQFDLQLVLNRLRRRPGRAARRTGSPRARSRPGCPRGR